MLFKTRALFITVYPPGSGSTSQCTLSLCTHWAVDLHHSALFITVYSPHIGSTSQHTLYHCVPTGQWIYITVHSLSLCTHWAVDLHPSTLFVTVYSQHSGSPLQYTLYPRALTGHRLVCVEVPDLHHEGVHTQVLSIGDELGHHNTGIGCLSHCDTHHSLTCVICALLIYTQSLMHTHA